MQTSSVLRNKIFLTVIQGLICVCIMLRRYSTICKNNFIVTGREKLSSMPVGGGAAASAAATPAGAAAPAAEEKKGKFSFDYSTLQVS